jgi:DNA-binding transcriptional MerR regulator
VIASYKLDELARIADVAARTIRYYVQRGLLPAPEFRGKDTAYGHEHLLRLQAIRRLQALHLPLDAIQARLAALSPAELAALASDEDPPKPRRAARPGPTRTPSPQPAVGELWERIQLAPGLELHVRADAGPRARALALAIQSAHGETDE